MFDNASLALLINNSGKLRFDSLGVMNREEFLKAIWRDVIEAPMSEAWVDNLISSFKKKPSAPFAELGPVLESMLAKGVSQRELSLVNRFGAYEACFQLLYMFEDPGVDDASMLHESLLSADPTGTEGRRAAKQVP